MRKSVGNRKIIMVLQLKIQVKVKVKVMVKLALEPATKTQRGSRGIALLFP
jgi:hypothetical protein